MSPSNSPQKKVVRELLAERGLLDDDVLAIKLHDTSGHDALVDLATQVPNDAKFDLVRRKDKQALELIRHSTAHVMADAVQRLFPGTKVTFGPATDNGFYYDFDRPEGSFSEEDLAKIESAMREIIGIEPIERHSDPRHEPLRDPQPFGNRVELLQLTPG